MARNKEKEFDPIDEWNTFVKGFLMAEGAWKKLSAYTLSTNDASHKYFNRICRTTRFRYAVESFVQSWGIRTDLHEFLINNNKEKGE